jgi:hypothetical protein
MRFAAIIVIAACAAAAVFALAMSGWPAAIYRDGDFFQFYAGSRALLEGASPYDPTWWRSFHERESSRALENLHRMYADASWTTPYPLWVFVLALPFGLLPLSVAAPAWLVLQLLGVAAGVTALARASRLADDRAGLALAAILTATFQPTLFLTWTGNVTGFVFAALALGAALAMRGRFGSAGASLALLAIKPQSLVVAAIALFGGAPATARRRLAAGAGTVVLALVAAGFVASPSWVRPWLAAAGALQASVGSNATGWALGRVIGGPLVSIAAVSLVTIAFAAWWLARRPSYAALIAAAIPVSVFVAPYGWLHEQLYLLASAILLLAHAVPLAGAARALGFAVILLGFGVLPWLAVVVPRDETPSALVPVVAFAIAVWIETRARPERDQVAEAGARRPVAAV